MQENRVVLLRRSFLAGLGLVAGGLALGFGEGLAEAAPAAAKPAPAELRQNVVVHVAIDGLLFENPLLRTGLALAGANYGEALRQAQIAMLNRADRAHPYSWASFIVSGNPAALDGRPVEPNFGGEGEQGRPGAKAV